MTVTSEAPRLVHDALFYATPQEYAASLEEFVRGGLENDEPVLVAVPEPNLALLRERLGADADAVRFADMGRAGRNPGRIIGSVLTAFVREHAGRRVRVVGEPIWAGRSDEEYPACAQHEALINLALADSPLHVVCPYDVSRLTPDVLTDATRTHPVLARGAERWSSPGYADPAAVAASFDRRLPAAPPDADVLVLVPRTGPRDARRVVHEAAERAGLPQRRVADLRTIAQELAVNTLQHSGGAGLLSVWTTDREVVLQVQDGGRFTDPLAGRRPPTPPEVGHGLFTVHTLADLVRLHHGTDGTTVRVHVVR